MKAVVIDEYGDNSVVQLRDVDRPEPRAGEVLVKIQAAGVNSIDWKIRNGAGDRLGLTLPIQLGREFVGIVERLGEGVDWFGEGDAVYGLVDTGGFSEYAVVDAMTVVRKPADLDFVHAAALPLAALTAWQAMYDVAGLTAGQRLFVTNASGGVGTLAVQIAKANGVHVTAMASGRNEDYVRSLGADEFIDHTKQPFETVARDMDVVLDLVGGDIFQRAFSTLRKGGFLVTAVAFPKDEAHQHGVGVGRVHCKPNARQLALVGDLVDAGKLQVRIDTVLPQADVKRALELSEGGRLRGKIVLQIAA